MKLEKTKAVKGWFLACTDEEFDGIREELGRRDYEENASGLKEFLMDCLFAPEEEEHPRMKTSENLINMGQDFIKKHPEVVMMGKIAAQNLMGKLGKKLF